MVPFAGADDAPVERLRRKAFPHLNGTLGLKVQGWVGSSNKTYHFAFRGPYMAYYKPSRGTAHARGWIVLSDTTTAEPGPDDDGSFTVNTPGGKYTLLAPDAAARRAWVVAIQGVVEMLAGDFSLPVVPPPVTSVAVRNRTHDTIELSWTPPGGLRLAEAVSGYEVTRRIAKGVPRLSGTGMIISPAEADVGETAAGGAEGLQWGDALLVGPAGACTVSGLSPRVPYEFRVAALNDVGKGDPGPPAAVTWTLGKPSHPPEAPELSAPTVSSLGVAWVQPPAEDDDAALQGYLIQTFPAGDDAGDLVETEVEGASSTFVTVSGLKPDTLYAATVAARNVAGIGPLSRASAPAYTKGPPTVVPTPPAFATATPNTLAVTFEGTPLGDHDDVLTGYRVECAPADAVGGAGDPESTQLVDVGVHVASSGTPVQFEGLASDTQYVFRLQALNVVAPGPRSPWSAPLWTQGPPTIAPSTSPVLSSAGTSQVTVAWDGAPLGDHDAPTTGYLLKLHAVGGVGSEGEGTEHEFLGADSTMGGQVLAGLVPDTLYEATVAVVNVLGNGPFSAPSQRIWTLGPPTVAPQSVVCCSQSHDAIEIDWTDPEAHDTHDAPTTGYQVVWRRTSGHVDAPEESDPIEVPLSARPVRVTGLQPDCQYVFTVSARNDVGLGPPSVPSADIWTLGPPKARPVAPDIVATAVNELRVVWTAPPPADHDAPCTGFELEWRAADADAPEGRLAVAGAGATEATVTGVQAATQYIVTVAVVNSLGTGPYSPPSGPRWSKREPQVVPAPPHCVGASPASVEITWETTELGPDDADLTGYVVRAVREQTQFPDATEDESSVQLEKELPVGSEAGIMFDGLTPDSRYTFSVAAANVVGAGGFSAKSAPIWTLGSPANAPAQPACSDATADSFAVRWAAGRPGDHDAPLRGFYGRVWVLEEDAEEGRVQVDTFETHAVGETSYVVKGLLADRQYVVDVCAVNEVGHGPVSDVSKPIWTLGPPTKKAKAPMCSSPTIDSVRVSWAAVSLGDHDSPITRYTLHWTKLGDDASGAGGAAGGSGDAAEPTGQSGTVAAGDSLSCVVEDLKPGTVYTFCVMPGNDVGDGPEGAASKPCHTLTAPTIAPKAPTMTSRTDGTLGVRWRAPAKGKHDAPLDGYIVHCRPTEPAGHEWDTFGVDGADADSFTLSGLEPGTDYEVAVAARNAAGAGPLGATVSLRTLGAPSRAPGVPKWSAPSFDTVQVKWKAATAGPDDMPITGYWLVCKPAGADVTASVRELRVNHEVCEALVDGLEPESEYELAVAATNVVGDGVLSGVSAPVKTLGRPTVPPSTPKCASPTISSIALSWKPPKLGADDGAVDGYRVKWWVALADAGGGEGAAGGAGGSAGDGDGDEAAAAHAAPADGVVAAGEVDVGEATNCVTSDLAAGTLYEFAVLAYNRVGEGPLSARTAPYQTLSPPTTAPKAPRATKRKEQSMTVKWSAVQLDKRNAALTAYRVRWRRKGIADWEYQECDKAKTSMDLDSLSPGTTYEITVACRNAAGLGPWSAPTEALTLGRPRVPPPKPHCTAATMHSVTVEWASPELGQDDAPVSQYMVGVRRVRTTSDSAAAGAGDGARESGARIVTSLDASKSVEGDTHSATLSGLTAGVKYEAFVCAINKHSGQGPFSEASDPIQTLGAPTTAPPPPVARERSTQRIVVHWEPAAPGARDAPTTGYYVRWRTGDVDWAEEKLGVEDRVLEMRGLTPETVYEVAVSAFNEAGEGPACPVTRLRTLGRPSNAPGKPICSEPTKDSVVVQWTPCTEGPDDAPITGYRVAWRVVGAGTDFDQEVSVARDEAVQITGLPSATTFEFRTVACNPAGAGRVWSEVSAPVTTLVDPAAALMHTPALVEPEAAGGGAIGGAIGGDDDKRKKRKKKKKKKRESAAGLAAEGGDATKKTKKKRGSTAAPAAEAGDVRALLAGMAGSGATSPVPDASTVKCPSCSSELPRTVKFCTSCGSPVAAARPSMLGASPTASPTSAASPASTGVSHSTGSFAGSPPGAAAPAPRAPAAAGAAEPARPAGSALANTAAPAAPATATRRAERPSMFSSGAAAAPPVAVSEPSPGGSRAPCDVCGAALPPGAAACVKCGSPVLTRRQPPAPTPAAAPMRPPADSVDSTGSDDWGMARPSYALPSISGGSAAPARSGVPCVSCGHVLTAGLRFCTSCGAKQTA